MMPLPGWVLVCWSDAKEVRSEHNSNSNDRATVRDGTGRPPGAWCCCCSSPHRLVNATLILGARAILIKVIIMVEPNADRISLAYSPFLLATATDTVVLVGEAASLCVAPRELCMRFINERGTSWL